MLVFKKDVMTESKIGMNQHLICDRCKKDLGRFSYVSQYMYCPYCGKYLKGFSLKEWIKSKFKK